MTSITVPSAGNDILASWGESVADALNLLGIILSSNVTTSSASFADLTGLSFTADSGKNYNIEFFLTYECSSTSGGPVVGYDGPSGDCLFYVVYAGETAADSSTVTQVSAEDSGAGVATVDTADAKRVIRGWAIFQATATGTFTLRMKRNTAGTVTFHKGGAMRVVSS